MLHACFEALLAFLFQKFKESHTGSQGQNVGNLQMARKSSWRPDSSGNCSRDCPVFFASLSCTKVPSKRKGSSHSYLSWSFCLSSTACASGGLGCPPKWGELGLAAPLQMCAPPRLRHSF